MKYFALTLLVSVTLAAPIYRPASEVATAFRQAFAAMNLPVEPSTGSVITSGPVETTAEAVAGFVDEPTSAVESGWDYARISISIRLVELGPSPTELAVVAQIERFGVASRELLIPPAWTRASSNGRLEAALLDAVRAILTGSKPTRVPFPVLEASESGAGPTDNPPFIPNVRASNDPGTGNQNETTIAMLAGGYLFGGWNDNRTGVYHVGFARSTDSGSTWLPDTIMDHPGYEEDGDPVLAVDDSGVVYYLWLSFNRSNMTGDLILTKSRDTGRTWGPMQILTPGTPNTLDDKPWMTIDGNDVYVTWYDYGGSNGFKFIHSTDRGATWTTPVSVGSGGNGTFPLRGRDSTVYVVWGYQDIKFNKSTNWGRTWTGQRTIITCPWSPRSTPFRINNIPNFARSRDRTKLYVCFCDSRNRSGQLDVFVARSTDDGATWGTPVKVNDTPSGDTTLQFYPWIAVDPYDRLHVAWHDTRRGGNNIGQYYAYSTDLGSTWSANYRVSDTVSLTSTFIGDYNACAADSRHVYVLWSDARNGASNPDAYFSRALHPAPLPDDAGVAAIIAPVGDIDSGSSVTPQALVRNYGMTTATVPVTFRILRRDSLEYEETTSVALDPGDSSVVSFGAWQPAVPDSYFSVAFTRLPGDANPGNDTARAACRVRGVVHDVGAVAVLYPAGDTVDWGTVITPLALVKNFGTRPETFTAWFVITGGYAAADTLTLAAGFADTARFAAWTADSSGLINVRCSTALAGDADPANDTAGSWIYVLPPQAVEEGGALRTLSLGQARPNPASGIATVSFVLPRAAATELALYDAAGRDVRTFVRGVRAAGRQDCRLDVGHLPAGVYWLKLTTGGAALTRKLAVQR